MKEPQYLAYHTPRRMGYGGSSVDVQAVATKKAGVARTAISEGATVWLIGREEDRRGVFWYGWLRAARWVPDPDDEDFRGSLHGDPAGSHMFPLNGGEPVLLDDQPWLKEALNVLGNGAFGLQRLQRPAVIQGLEALRRSLS